MTGNACDSGLRPGTTPKPDPYTTVKRPLPPGCPVVSKPDCWTTITRIAT